MDTVLDPDRLRSAAASMSAKHDFRSQMSASRVDGRCASRLLFTEFET